MSNAFHEYLHEVEDDKLELENFTTDFKNTTLLDDDTVLNPDINRHIEFILDSITRIGGEVCRLRAEMDGLLDQNGALVDTFKKLKDVIDEKGLLDMDDFQLACDVFEESNTKFMGNNFGKKTSH